MVHDDNVRYLVFPEGVSSEEVLRDVRSGIKRAKLNDKIDIHRAIDYNNILAIRFLDDLNQDRFVSLCRTVTGIAKLVVGGEVELMEEVSYRSRDSSGGRNNKSRNHHRSSSERDLRRKIESLERENLELQNQLTDSEVYVVAYNKSLISKERFDNRISDLESTIRGDNSRARLFAFGERFSGRVEEFQSISEAYESALNTSGLDFTEDVNEQILDALSRGELSFEEALDGSELTQYKESLKLIETFTSGPLYDAAKGIVDDFIRRKEEYDSATKNIAPLQEALTGKSVRYLMTSESDGSNYVIGLTMPILHKDKATEFSELELDLINHVYDQWNGFRADFNVKFDERSDVGGLVYYSFRVPKKDRSIEEINDLGSKLSATIFNSQSSYAFGALGLRIDIDRFSSTSERQVPGVGLELEVSGPMNRDYDYYEAVSRSYSKIPRDNPVWRAREGSTRGDLSRGILILLSSSNPQGLTNRELRPSLETMFPDHIAKINDNSTMSNVLARLRDNYGLIEITGTENNADSRGITNIYKIKEEFR